MGILAYLETSFFNVIFFTVSQIYLLLFSLYLC